MLKNLNLSLLLIMIFSFASNCVQAADDDEVQTLSRSSTPPMRYGQEDLQSFPKEHLIKLYIEQQDELSCSRVGGDGRATPPMLYSKQDLQTVSEETLIEMFLSQQSQIPSCPEAERRRQ